MLLMSVELARSASSETPCLEGWKEGLPSVS